VPAADVAFGSEDRFLLVVQPLRTAVAQCAGGAGAYREYQQRALARDGLRRMYLGTLTLALILAVFGAVLLASCWAPARAAAAAAGRRRAPGGRRRPDAPSRCSRRATNWAA
jgi:hypothetical protein